MDYESWYDTDENKTLLAICARKLISNIGVGGILWGLLNTVIGIVAIQDTVINAGILILGLMMLATGIQALRAPSLGVLLAETIVTVLILVWNLGISVLNFLVLGVFDPLGLIFPLIVAIVFFGFYRRLGHLREQIRSVEPEQIKATKEICKTLAKKKLKEEVSIIRTKDGKCGAQLMEDRAFFIQRDLMRAFVAPKEDVGRSIARADAKRLKMTFRHPLGVLKYQFDKKNSEKIRNWLSAEAGPTAESGTAL